MLYARIDAGRVAEKPFEIPDGGPPLAERFHPDIVAACVAVPAGVPVAEGWSYTNGAFSAPPGPTLAEMREARTTSAKAEFSARIAAGMPWGDTRLQIDTDSRTNLLGAKGLADAGALPDPFAWRMQDNSMLPLDAAGVQAMATAAGLYYAGLFAVKSALVDAIAAAPDVAAVEAIDVTAGWPA